MQQEIPLDNNALLPKRVGPRPSTTDCAPHSQIDQLPDLATRQQLSQMLVEEFAALPHVSTGSSRRAPYGSVGFYLDSAVATTDCQCFLLGNEFAHVHLLDDGSLHAILSEPLKTAAIEAGWAEHHPMAGQPTVSPDTVMIYTPRSKEEVRVVISLIRKSWKNAHQSSEGPRAS